MHTEAQVPQITAKLNADDPSRTDTVVEHYTQNIDHQLILDLAGYKEG